MADQTQIPDESSPPGPPTAPTRGGRRIKNPRVTFVSLVPRGANKIPGLYKADDALFGADPLSKADVEKGLLTSLVYVPNRPDSKGDYMLPEDVEYACHSWMAKGCKMDLFHSLKELEKSDLHCVECFIVQPGDARFAGWKDRDGKVVDATGAWATVSKVENSALKELARSGEMVDVSLYSFGGDYQIENKPLGKSEGDPHSEETPMNDAQIKALTEGLAAAVVTAMAAQAPAPATPVAKADEAPKVPLFKGDVTDLAAVTQYQRQLELHELKKSLDLGTAEGVLAYRENLIALKKEWEVEDAALGIKAPAHTSAVGGIRRLGSPLERSAQQTQAIDHGTFKVIEDDEVLALSKSDQEEVAKMALEASKAAFAKVGRTFDPANPQG